MRALFYSDAGGLVSSGRVTVSRKLESLPQEISDEMMARACPLLQGPIHCASPSLIWWRGKAGSDDADMTMPSVGPFRGQDCLHEEVVHAGLLCVTPLLEPPRRGMTGELPVPEAAVGVAEQTFLVHRASDNVAEAIQSGIRLVLAFPLLPELSILN